MGFCLTLVTQLFGSEQVSHLNEAKVVVVQKIFEGLRQSFVWCADHKTLVIIWTPADTRYHSEFLTSKLQSLFQTAIFKKISFQESFSSSV